MLIYYYYFIIIIGINDQGYIVS